MVTVAALALAASQLASPAAPAPEPLGADVSGVTPAEVLVFVSGAVQHPGLYQLSAAARVSDAIAAAGGITTDADPGKLPDLAATVHDGRQINVPFLRSSSVRVTRLNVNAASADELAAIPGMPPGLPQAIVADRQQWGPFASMADLRAALGLDVNASRALSPYLSFGPPP